MKQTKTQNFEWRVGVLTSFLRSPKSITKTPLLFAFEIFLSSFQFFKQIAVSEHRVDFCKVPNCQNYLLIHEETIDFVFFQD